MPEPSLYTMQDNATKIVQKELAYNILKYIKTNEVELFDITKNLPYSQEAIFDCFSIYHPDLFSHRNNIFMGQDMLPDAELLIKASYKGLDFFFENSIYKN